MTSPGKLNGLDHLRALAITFVFLFHYQISIFGHPTWLEDFAKFGWSGVDLFFVLSGFLISSQLFSQVRQGGTFSFRDFFVKRFFRIIPAFGFTLAIYFCFPAFHEREALPPLWKFLTFTQNLGLDIKHFGTFSHAWSLCVEEYFYLLLPLLLMLMVSFKFFKRGYWLVIVLFLLGFAIRNYSWNSFYVPLINEEASWRFWYMYIYYPGYNRLDGLLVGVSIAMLCQFRPLFWQRISAFGNLLFFAGLCVLTGAYFLCYEERSYYASIFGFPVVAIGYGFLVIGAISPTSFLYKWNSKITASIASLSYVIYLTHKGIIHIAQKFLAVQGIDINSNAAMIVCIVSCILIALLLHWSIEKPF
ncbi:MAG TPA: acyltransferase, partial [Bacteroidia bacterium]|nr:acyltransferase [Bacteroidia bacterium]